MVNRIVSLIPSGTEIVSALGCADKLVGRSHECDYPTLVEPLPVCTSPKFDTSVPSVEIDKSVRNLVENALSVYRVHDDVLGSLTPDAIVTQSQCELCAVSQSDVEASVASVLNDDTAIASMEAVDLAGLWRDITHTGEVIGVDPEPLLDRLKARIDTIRHRVPDGRQPRVACLEWIEPLMFAGNWVPELVALAGGEDVFGKAGDHSTVISWEQVQAADPDIVILMPCGYDLERTREEIPLLTKLRGWETLRAAREGSIYITDGNHYFNRPGLRLVDSLEILVEILHSPDPNLARKGVSWEPADTP
jgi:iron complex transport system substrate-binding protein